MHHQLLRASMGSSGTPGCSPPAGCRSLERKALVLLTEPELRELGMPAAHLPQTSPPAAFPVAGSQAHPTRCRHAEQEEKRTQDQP